MSTTRRFLLSMLFAACLAPPTAYAQTDALYKVGAVQPGSPAQVPVHVSSVTDVTNCSDPNDSRQGHHVNSFDQQRISTLR